jgi:hypothetical protein
MEAIMKSGVRKQTLNKGMKVNIRTRVGAKCAPLIQPMKKFLGYNWNKTCALF